MGSREGQTDNLAAKTNRVGAERHAKTIELLQYFRECKSGKAQATPEQAEAAKRRGR